MTVCLLARVVAGVLPVLPTALAAGGGATGTAALVLGVTVSEL